MEPRPAFPFLFVLVELFFLPLFSSFSFSIKTLRSTPERCLEDNTHSKAVRKVHEGIQLETFPWDKNCKEETILSGGRKSEPHCVIC